MITDIFEETLTGLSEDMEDFMLEQDDHYSHYSHKFYTSFWKTCVSMWQDGIDLTHKQLDIIHREYNKIKELRAKVFRPVYTCSNLLIAINFVRIEHGGRGDYIEINPFQICLNNLYIPQDKLWKLKNQKVDYIEFRTIRDNIKVYYQVNVQYVDYAHYNIGFYYVSPKNISANKTITILDF